jgi:DNA invertase Pin-like site-specific DNA recombinase
MQAAPIITYIRVSTSGQGRSGLGIEAQRRVLAQFAQGEGFEVAREFVEVETGKGADALDRRPQLRRPWLLHGNSSAMWPSPS